MMSVTSDINACRDGIVGVGREGEWVGVGVGKREGESDADVKICLRGRQRERERERERECTTMGKVNKHHPTPFI